MLGDANQAYRIMLVDLYERPYSPEASRSRAFIDRILALSGPDGGVVGGEDGISTQRPLKDGGREAWDMIRRLRQKAWQKAGLNPRMLWTEKDQIHIGVASPSVQHVDDGSSSDLAHIESLDSAPGDSKPHDFNKRFYNITRSHTYLNPATPPSAQSPLRHQYPPENKHVPPTLSNSQFDPLAGTIPTISLDQHSLDLSSFGVPPPTHPPTSVPGLSNQHPTSGLDASATIPFIDAASPNPMAMGVPTPPSMVDPNLNFDWDQWDAVFGQHLPVSDDLMELDPVSGLDFANIATSSANHDVPGAIATSIYPSGLPRSSPSDPPRVSNTDNWPANY